MFRSTSRIFEFIGSIKSERYGRHFLQGQIQGFPSCKNADDEAIFGAAVNGSERFDFAVC